MSKKWIRYNGGKPLPLRYNVYMVNEIYFCKDLMKTIGWMLHVNPDN